MGYPQKRMIAALLCLVVVIAAFSSRNASIEDTAQPKKCYASDCQTQKESAEEAIARYNWWLTLFTAILAVATTGLGAATVGLFFAGRNQLHLARDEFLSTHRPKIRIKHVWLMSEMLVYDEPFTVRVVCVNRGRSDAFMVDYNIGFFVIRRGRGLPVDPQIPSILISGKLPSGISLPFPDISHQITQDDEIGIRNQMADLFCLGSVHYKDGAGRMRTTGFCRKLDLSDTVLRVGRTRFRPVEDTEFEYTD
jgi:hypothetical protein